MLEQIKKGGEGERDSPTNRAAIRMTRINNLSIPRRTHCITLIESCAAAVLVQRVEVVVAGDDFEADGSEEKSETG